MTTGLLGALVLAASPALDYPGSRLTPIGREALVLGQRQRIAYFTTADAPEAVAAYFARRWRADGWAVIAQREPSVGAWVVAGFATRTGTLVAVTAQRSGRRTLAFAAVRATWDAPRRPR